MLIYKICLGKKVASKNKSSIFKKSAVKVLPVQRCAIVVLEAIAKKSFPGLIPGTKCTYAIISHALVTTHLCNLVLVEIH